jgi:hypothetical protein
MQLTFQLLHAIRHQLPLGGNDDQDQYKECQENALYNLSGSRHTTLTYIKELIFGGQYRGFIQNLHFPATQHPDSLCLIGKMLKQHYSFLQRKQDCTDQENLMIFSGI